MNDIQSHMILEIIEIGMIIHSTNIYLINICVVHCIIWVLPPWEFTFYCWGINIF